MAAIITTIMAAVIATNVAAITTSIYSSCHNNHLWQLSTTSAWRDDRHNNYHDSHHDQFQIELVAVMAAIITTILKSHPEGMMLKGPRKHWHTLTGRAYTNRDGHTPTGMSTH